MVGREKKESKKAKTADRANGFPPLGEKEKKWLDRMFDFLANTGKKRAASAPQFPDSKKNIHDAQVFFSPKRVWGPLCMVVKGSISALATVIPTTSAVVVAARISGKNASAASAASPPPLQQQSSQCTYFFLSLLAI